MVTSSALGPVAAGIFAGLVAGAAAGFVTATWSAEPPPPLSGTRPDDALNNGGVSFGGGSGDLTGRLAAFEGRIEELERALEDASRQAIPASAGVGADPSGDGVGAPSDAEVWTNRTAAEITKRLGELERTVAMLSERTGGLGLMPDTLEGVLLALDDKNLKGHRLNDAQKERRKALNQWLVDNYPAHTKAKGALQQLITDVHLREGAGEALKELEQRAPAVGLDGWALDRTRANLLGQSGRHEAAREIYWRRESERGIAAHDRASAMFWRGYSFQQEGRTEEALAVYRQLIAEYGDSKEPGVDSSVGGARNQLEKLDKRGR